MAVGTAQILFEALPAAAPKDAIDALKGAFGIFRLLQREIIVLVTVPVLAPLVDISRHVEEPIAVKLLQRV